MVAIYTIAGRQVGSHVLAMVTLGGTGAFAYLSTRGGGKKDAKAPKIEASSGDEEKFIKDFLAAAEKETAK